MPSYAGMNAAEIAAWILIATAAGWGARKIVKGKPFFALWGDMAIALVGVFLMDLLFGLLGVDIAARLASFLPDSFADFALWIRIAISAILGALAIRLVLRPFTGGGG
jgi:uncharacterized membrane protein YeaQ/YmgE (transglycosylase-associated protein family)